MYPPFENSTTRIAILLVQNKRLCSFGVIFLFTGLHFEVHTCLVGICIWQLNGVLVLCKIISGHLGTPTERMTRKPRRGKKGSESCLGNQLSIIGHEGAALAQKGEILYEVTSSLIFFTILT